jgi:hypothetical protein
MAGNNQTETPIGYFEDIVPIFQSEEVTKEQAEEASNNIIVAYFYLIKNNSGSYSAIINKLQEIHIVTTVANEKYKYELYPIENKFIIKFKYDITYTEAIYCIMDISAKLTV